MKALGALAVGGPVAVVLGVATFVPLLLASSSTTTPAGTLRADAVPAPFRAAVQAAGGRCAQVSAPLLAAQISVESGWSPTATSPAGAQGIAQFMPGTWSTWGRDYDGDGVANVMDPADAIGSEADYLCSLAGWAKSQIEAGKVRGDLVDLMLAAYNAGEGTVAAAGGVPDISETTAYVARVRAALSTYTASVVVDAGGGPPVSADGTFRMPQAGSGQLDPATLCQIPWAGPGKVLRCDAEASFAQLDDAFRARFGSDLQIDSAYRSLAAQVLTKAEKGGLAAIPGTSNHGWGLAVDLGSGVGTWGSPQRAWMVANARTYGWSSPSWAQPSGSGPVEAWHWEFVGVSS